MADNQQTFETQMTADVSDLVKGMNTVKTSLGEVEKAANAVVASLANLEKMDFSKVQKNITKLSNIKIPTVSTKSGTIASPSGRTNRAFAQAQDSVVADLQKQVELTNELIEKEKALTALKKEEATVVAKNAESKRIAAQAKADKAAFLNSNENKEYIKSLTNKANRLSNFYDYKNKHPELFTSGWESRSWKYQGARTLSAVGQASKGLPIGGQLLSSVFDIGAGFLKSPAAGVVTIFKQIGEGLIDLTKIASKAFAEIESTKTQLEVVFSSRTQSDALFEDISQYAVKSPFSVQETTEMAILLKQSGVYASDLMNTLKMIGDTAGGNMEKMKRIANNYAQIVSIGKASMMDMRQFAYAGIPIFEAVSEELGVSQSRLRELISDGKVTSEIIEKVFKNLTGVNGVFQDATEKGAKTLKARLQNFADAKQLAMASLGEYGANIGRKTGNDSSLDKLVTGVENIYNWLHGCVNTINIQKDVKTIANRNNRIEELKELIEYNDKLGNKNYSKVLKEELNELLSRENIESDRATYENMYKNIQDRFSSVLSKYGVYDSDIEYIDLKNVEDVLKSVRKDRKVTFSKYAEANKEATARGNTSTLSDPELYALYQDAEKRASLYRGEADILNEDFKTLNNALKELSNIQHEYIQAHRETNVIAAQQLEFDRANKATRATGSLNSMFQELASIYENSEEQKKKREEEHIKALKAAQEELRKLNAKSDEIGKVNFEQFSITDFLHYVNAGAFESRKLLNANNKDLKGMREDAPILQKQFGNALSTVISELEVKGIDEKYINKLKGELRINNTQSPVRDKEIKSFYKNFADSFHRTEKLLNNLKDKDKDNEFFYTRLSQYLTDSQFTWSYNNTGTNANLDEKEKEKVKSQNIFIPFWKRLLATETGVSANLIKSTSDTIDLFQNEVLTREFSKNMFAEILKAGGSVSDVQKYLTPSGERKNLRGDIGYTYQIDFKETSQRLREFANQLHYSTRYIKTYQSSLEHEYDAYINLIANGVTSAESVDVTTTKTMESKKWGELTKDAGEAFVNAFGEALVNGDDKHIAKIENGIAYGDDGKVLANQQVKITGNLYSIIERELPKVRKELEDARKRSLQTEIKEEAVSKAKDLTFDNAIQLSMFANPDYSKIIASNKDSIKKFANEDAARILREKRGLKETDTVTEEDVSEAFAEGEITVNDLKKVIIEAVGKVLQDKGYQKSEDTTKKQEELSKDLNFVEQLYGQKKNEPEEFSFDNINKETYEKNRGQFLTNITDDLFAKPAMESIGLTPRNFNNIDYETINADRKEKRDEAARQLSNWEETGNIDTSKLAELGIDKSQLEKLADFNTPYQERLAILEEIIEANKDITAEESRHEVAQQSMANALKNARDETVKLAKETAKKAFLTPFEKIGESLVTGEDACSLMADSFKELGGEVLSALGNIMIQTGLQIAGAAALDHNWAGVAGGLALAAAGGLATGFGGALASGKKESDESDDKTAKLESLSEKIADLLRQAKEDADYYESNLRHRTALGINAGYSNKITSVNDAIITPQGKVISTAPDDYLIATKTPETLGNNTQVTVQPKVNITVNKNTKANVDVNVEQKTNPDGSLEVVAYIEDIVGQYIGSTRSDGAFATRQAMSRGIQGVM